MNTYFQTFKKKAIFLILLLKPTSTQVATAPLEWVVIVTESHGICSWSLFFCCERALRSPGWLFQSGHLPVLKKFWIHISKLIVPGALLKIPALAPAPNSQIVPEFMLVRFVDGKTSLSDHVKNGNGRFSIRPFKQLTKFAFTCSIVNDNYRNMWIVLQHLITSAITDRSRSMPKIAENGTDGIVSSRCTFHRSSRDSFFREHEESNDKDFSSTAGEWSDKTITMSISVMGIVTICYAVSVIHCLFIRQMIPNFHFLRLTDLKSCRWYHLFIQILVFLRL